MASKNIDGKTILFRTQTLGVVLTIGVIGTIVTLATHAASNSTISGTAFYDLNRNGVQDAGETPLADQGIYLLDQTGQAQVAYTITDANGKYTLSGLSDATYRLQYDSENWQALRKDWAPTTTGSLLPTKTVNLAGLAKVDFGWRKIIRSTDINAPISSYTTPSGTKINSYDDVVKATDIYTELAKGSLFGREAPLTTIAFDFNNSPNVTFTGIGGSPGSYANYVADVRLDYDYWLDSGDSLLFHEYGHAWSLYNAYINAQSINFTEYLKIRGIKDDPRLDTSHSWSRQEMIAEDYRQLFGSPNAQFGRQENSDLPAAKDVPGLRDYLSGAFIAQSTTDTQAPTIPGNFKATVLSTSTVRLSWTPSTDNVGVTKYRIIRMSNAGRVDRDVDASTTSFDDTGLSSTLSYTYIVQAYDAATNYSATPEITVNTSAPDTQAPTVPANLTGKASSTSEGSGITLTWNPSTDNVGVDKYLIFRDGTQIAYVNSPSTTFSDSGLIANKTYQYAIKAVDVAGNTSAPTPIITVNAGSLDTTAPTKPTSLTSPTQTTTSIGLKWNPSTDNIGVTGYRIYQVGGTRKNSFNTLLTTTTNTNYNVTGLTKGTTYSFYIVAVDAAGNQSPPSSTLTVKTKR